MEEKINKMMSLDNKKILITGTAGFVGFHMANFLLSKGFEVVGIDGMTDYYDLKLKRDRHEILKKKNNFYCYEIMLEDKKKLAEIFKDYNPKILIHLAAQAGVRYSFENPKSYIEYNIQGTYNLLQEVKNYEVIHVLIASTSSVYGGNKKLPFHETDVCASPKSFYAATKLGMENMSHSYSSFYNIPTTILRFFTAYGPWGRPDMALFKFTSAILNNKPIDIYNHGKMKRDFTYIDDLIKSIYLLLEKSPKRSTNKMNKITNDSISEIAPWRIINIGNSLPIELSDFISILEKKLNKKAMKNYLKLQPGDMIETYSDVTLLKTLTGFVPNTKLSDGIIKFINWYESYH